jgi:hypothetical protein
MPRMFTPTVIEALIELEPVTADTFVADLSQAHDGRGAALLALATAAPRRRIYD